MNHAIIAHVAQAPLSAKEQALHDRCERAIEQAERGFQDIGEALFEILTARTYRPQTWVAYVQKRWDKSEDWAAQQIAAAKVMANLRAAMKKEKPTICRVLPANEGQARALTGLDPAQQWEAWKKAVIAGRGKATAALVAKAVEALIGRPPGAAPGEVSVEQARLVASLEMEPEDQQELLDRKEKEAAPDGAPRDEEPGPCERWGKVLDKAAKLVDEKDQWGQEWVEQGRKHFLKISAA